MTVFSSELRQPYEGAAIEIDASGYKGRIQGEDSIWKITDPNLPAVIEKYHLLAL